MEIEVSYTVAESDAALLPADAKIHAQLPDAALIPQKDDIVLLSPQSAWMVVARVFQHLPPDRMRVQLWLTPAPQLLQAMQGRRQVLH